MKTLWAMLGALLISIIILDLGMVYITYDKLAKVTEQALDAAITAGINPEDAYLGRINIDSVSARDTALAYFRDNLGLDTNLENDILKNTQFLISVNQDTDPHHAGTRPYLEGQVSTRVTVISPKLFDSGGIPIRVKKTVFHRSTYK
ncbi:hypothetical protein [Phosphitispora fastidiosa]|uniref:hypothetical protein n=1 Tax=Phosphitispora fastidiosa TaxID=2837202 RepID=UPI001E5ADF6F|nr:hypothetical protein [Phosphitispora fastidiosa]MBU7007060.1 hypothetical protein [Phosphitispora fastidiosa]